MGQENFLSGLRLTWKRYQAFSGNWEHEHCKFCFKKFLDPAYAAWMRKALAEESDRYAAAGYTNLRYGDTPAGRHWVCRECFEDFRSEYGWVVRHSDPEGWPYGTTQPNSRPTAADYIDPNAATRGP